MTTTYDDTPAEFVWIEDGMPAAGDRAAFDQALRSDRPVKGLWRLTVLTEQGEDVLPVLVPADTSDDRATPGGSGNG